MRCETPDASSANASDVLAVYKIYMDRINSERQTVWARNNTLLLINVVIIGLVVTKEEFLASSDAALKSQLILGGFGLLITTL